MRRSSFFGVLPIVGWISTGMAVLTATAQTTSTPAHSVTAPQHTPPAPDKSPPEASIVLDFSYGSEKQKWIDSVTKTFNDAKLTIPGASDTKTVIVVKPFPMGSGEIIDELLSEKKKPHIVSPAAGAFIDIGNAASNEQNKGDLIGETSDLVLSPIVVMMWRETAEKLGWPNKPIKWKDLCDYASDPARWKQAAGADAAAFKLAHTQPDQSNSGLHAIFAQAFVASNKFAGLTLADVSKPEVKQYFAKVEKAVPYYETSTGFLGRRMLQDGPGALTAAVVYENLVIEANQKTAAANQPPAVVAVYPEEGTFPSEHPIGIVKRPWVTPGHEQAAKVYIDFLRDTEQQNEAKKYGFRPYHATAVSLGDLLKPASELMPASPSSS